MSAYLVKRIPFSEKIRTQIVDLADAIDQETETIPDVYRPLASAAVTFLREAAKAIINPIDSTQMHKDLIFAALDFNQRYETWLANLDSNSLDYTATRTLHEMLLRFSKGAVKAWRCWRIDLHK